MYKSLILLTFIIGLLGCGKKSTIKSHIEARALGDGQHITFPVVVPISEKSISSFKSPLKAINPLFRGFVGSMMNIGASIGAGKTALTLIQPIPDIPEDYLGSLKIKRIFFFLEPKDKKENFDFLRRLAVKISSDNMEREFDSWDPRIDPGRMDKEELNAFESLFPNKRDRRAQEWDDQTNGLVVIRYNQDELETSVQGDKFGKINIFQTNTPNAARKYFEENMGKYLERIHILSNSVLVELKNNRVVEEKFNMKLADDNKRVEQLGIGDINPCSENVCLDLKVPDVNLVPILKKGNAIKVETFIDPKSTPKSFQLKGFIEFEVKIKSKL